MANISKPQINLTKQVDLKKKFTRVGIVFYFYSNDELNFLLGVDSDNWELTDLGGIKLQGEDFMDTALREAYEESMRVIDMRKNKEAIYNNSIIVHNESLAIIFNQVEISSLPSLIISHRKNFIDGRNTNSERRFLENSFLVWIKSSDILNLLNKKQVTLPSFLSNVISSEEKGKNVYYPQIYDKVSEFLNPIMSQLCLLLQKC